MQWLKTALLFESGMEQLLNCAQKFDNLNQSLNRTKLNQFHLFSSLIALEDTDTAGVCRVYAENLLSTAVLKATGQKLFVDVFAYNDQSEKIKSLKIWVTATNFC